GALVVLAEGTDHRQRLAQVLAIAEGADVGQLDRRAIGHRVGEGHAQLDDIGPGCGQALEDGQRGVVVRVTGGDEGDQCRAVLLLQFFETALQTAHARLSSRFRWCITVCMSLSPRPDRLTTMMWS